MQLPGWGSSSAGPAGPTYQSPPFSTVGRRQIKSRVPLGTTDRREGFSPSHAEQLCLATALEIVTELCRPCRDSNQIFHLTPALRLRLRTGLRYCVPPALGFARRTPRNPCGCLSALSSSPCPPCLRGESASSQIGNSPQHFSKNSCISLPPFATLLNVGTKIPSRALYDPCFGNTRGVHQFLLAKSE